MNSTGNESVTQECPYCEDGMMYYETGGKVRCENCDATRLC